MEPRELFETIARRYGHIDIAALEKVLCPALIPIASIDPNIFKVAGQSHWRASFEIELAPQFETLLVPGRTGKFVPSNILEGETWREICKGRILSLNDTCAMGEIYTGATKSTLQIAVSELTTDCYLEIDQYGAAAKVLSSLVEYYLAKHLEEGGYKVRRMPEDMAKHIGTYKNYDFEVSKGGTTKRVEVKSLWGTNTRYARLIHSLGRNYPTSSCKFETQDFFAVSLFLRTGGIRDFAFARSVSLDDQAHGLPPAEKYPAHVNQNPLCEIGNGCWFRTLDEVWNLP